ncbi:MAG: hypothetical protein AAF191_03635 [Verrucomicrobiota bacterium]
MIAWYRRLSLLLLSGLLFPPLAFPGEEGAFLYSELGCANCHTPSTEVLIPRRGPSLRDLRTRVNHTWLTSFLKEDHQPLIDPDSIGDLLAYLGSAPSSLKLRPARHANAERGSALYHEIGCVACHDSGDHPFPSLAGKTSLTALSHFLGHVGRYRPDGRMPQLPVDTQEAVDIAAHLLDFQASDPREAPSVMPWPPPNPTAADRGKARFQTMGCAMCHEPDRESPGLPTHRHAFPSSHTPAYRLTQEETNALDAYLLRSTASDSPSPQAHTTLRALNCTACHARNGVGGPIPEKAPFFVGDASLGDSGRLPPPLTGIGHKLTKEWLTDVFQGEPGSRVRPYLKTRMPLYPQQAATLAEWLEDLDAPTQPTPISVGTDLEAGRQLLGTQGGVNCITCHQWEDKASLGLQAMDISALDERLRPSWFRQYLLDPASYRPGTLMPPLWPEGHSSIPGILEGNTEEQIGAIWAFIRHGSGEPPGFPDHVPGRFELVPTDRPMIQRTFLEEVGGRGILVGFPAGIHLAYNAETAQPAYFWQGRFFDAYETWFFRRAQFQTPLETTLFPINHSAIKPAKFLGYELDEHGNPTFLSRTEDGEQIRDHFQAKDGQLIQTRNDAKTWIYKTP